MAHHGHVDRVSRRDVWGLVHLAPGLKDVVEVHGKDLIRQTEKGVDAGSDRVTTADRALAVEDLLDHLDIGDQVLRLADETLQRATSVLFVRVSGAHQVHGDVGIEEDQTEST